MADGGVAGFTVALTVLPTDKLYLVRDGQDYQITPAVLFGSGLPITLNLQKPLALGGSVQTLSGSGAITSTGTLTNLTNDAQSVYTINDGEVDGQIKVIKMKEFGGVGVLSTNIDVASITWNAVGDTAVLMWSEDAEAWLWLAGTAAVVAP
jgi:hypothetical protein